VTAVIRDAVSLVSSCSPFCTRDGTRLERTDDHMHGPHDDLPIPACLMWSIGFWRSGRSRTGCRCWSALPRRLYVDSFRWDAGVAALAAVPA